MSSSKKPAVGNGFNLLSMKLKDIQGAKYNPRSISEDEKRALKESLRRFGLVEPLVWNKRTNTLVAGHQRLAILKDMGAEEVPVVVVDLPEVEEKALNITLNNPHAGGHWDADLLQSAMEQLEDELPDAFSDLGMYPLKDLSMGIGEPETGADGQVITGHGSGEHPDLELQAYEHYDYVVLFFKDQRDFMRAVQHFGAKKVNYSFTGKKKIGLGRCLDGAKYLERLHEKYGIEV